MKFTNVKQLIIKFMGGGLINFPTRFLRWVKINGDSDGSDGGSSDTDINQELEFLNQITDLIYQTNKFAFDADSEQHSCIPISDYNESWAEGTIILGNKETADYVIRVNDENKENFYTVFLTEEEYNYLVNTVDVNRNYFRDWIKNKFAFPINGYINYDNNTLDIFDGVPTENGNVIPNLFWYLKGALVYGIKGEDVGILGIEFNQDNWENMFEVPDTKFPFDQPTEGIYSGFVFADYEIITNPDYEVTPGSIITDLNNLPQKIYKAGETDFDEIYLVELTANNHKFYTIYAKSKTNDWVI